MEEVLGGWERGLFPNGNRETGNLEIVSISALANTARLSINLE
jgi:hypothetical protein